MTITGAAVAGPIAMIPSGRVLEQVGGQLGAFITEVDRLARQGMLPVTLEPHEDTWRMTLHTPRLVATLYPTAAGDAYRLGHAAPRRFRDEERLVAGALMLQVHHGFQVFTDVRTFNLATRQAPVRRSGHGEELWAAWQRVSAPAPAAPAPHGRFLDLMAGVVEAGRDIELRRRSAVPLQRYTARTDAREQRHSSRGVYRFRMLTDPAHLPKGTMVCLADEPDQRGRVLRVAGKDVTVRFDPGADFDRITPQGALKVLAGDRVYRAQLDAIDTLRRGRARNMRVLTALADGRFQPYQPKADATPHSRLDPAQLEAFHRAMDVPDLLCVLGPPGTGKTTTITEIARESAERGRRVLITSHTNRAVDNVLERLPADLNVVRIGSEDRIGDGVRALSAESRAEAARQQILADTSQLEQLDAVLRLRPVLHHHLDDLTARLPAATGAEAALQQAEQTLQAAVHTATASLRPAIDDAEHTLAGHRATAERLRRGVHDGAARIKRAETRALSGSAFAFLFAWYATWQQSRTDRLLAALRPADAAVQQSTAAVHELRRQADAIAAADPRVHHLTESREQARSTVSAAHQQLRQGAEQVVAALRPAADPPPLPDAAAGWTGFVHGCRALLERLEARSALQQQWRARISDLGSELEHEIARYADVVGATAIGTDTSALISDLEFDVVIVDEAGQISTPNLLVPLVRADRVVLVGDHHQLPPFLDDELRQWGERQAGADEQDTTQVMDLLAKSGFERVFPRAPRGNAVLLTLQRRMPEQIAGFVSATFYSNRLRTQHAGSPADPLFRSPLAMVNTADQPAGDRAETAMRGRGEAIAHGYRNELEADLITVLLTFYQCHYGDWAVIVPFNAQRELLLQRLQQALPSVPDLDTRVGSVDSFQGGERDLIVFGFTRSNPRGDVGFLSEVRRFNVAVSRARRQLVLVGDLDTLAAAKPRQFRAVIGDLRDHLHRTGDLRPSRAVTQALLAAREPHT